MKEMNDEELQQWLENKNQLPADRALNKDANAYRALFEALGEEPASDLPYNFAAKVTRHIQANEKRSGELQYNLVAALIFIVALAGIYGLLAFFTPDQASSLLKYKWILLLFPLAFIAIQYFDQRLVKARMFNNRSYKP
jgi:hypothetical protein